MIATAENMDEKLYTLRNMSNTRFVAYLSDCLVNNEESLKNSLEVLNKKSIENKKKETREKAARILKQRKAQQWMMTNLGVIDTARTHEQTFAESGTVPMGGAENTN